MQPSGVWALKPLVDMSQAEFRDWQALLEERTGVVINEQRRAFLQTNLTARMRELGVGDYASYYRQVTDGPRGAVEWSTLLDRLTVQETRFFRHRPSFEVLERYLRGRLAIDEQQQPLALWSVGCSSGEEPYSMAICASIHASVRSPARATSSHRRWMRLRRGRSRSRACARWRPTTRRPACSTRRCRR